MLSGHQDGFIQSSSSGEDDLVPKVFWEIQSSPGSFTGSCGDAFVIYWEAELRAIYVDEEKLKREDFFDLSLLAQTYILTLPVLSSQKQSSTSLGAQEARHLASAVLPGCLHKAQSQCQTDLCKQTEAAELCLGMGQNPQSSQSFPRESWVQLQVCSPGGGWINGREIL